MAVIHAKLPGGLYSDPKNPNSYHLFWGENMQLKIMDTNGEESIYDRTGRLYLTCQLQDISTLTTMSLDDFIQVCLKQNANDARGYANFCVEENFRKTGALVHSFEIPNNIDCVFRYHPNWSEVEPFDDQYPWEAVHNIYIRDTDFMYDVLGDPVYNGDLVVVMGTDPTTINNRWPDGHSLKVGIRMGKSVQCVHNQQAIGRMMKIAAPSEKQRAEAQKVRARLERERAERAERSAIKSTQNANEVGYLYGFDRGGDQYYKLLYCGKKHVTIYEDGEVIYEAKGHFYLSCPCWALKGKSEVTFSDCCRSVEEKLGETWRCLEQYYVRKNTKKYDNRMGPVEVPDKFEICSPKNSNYIQKPKPVRICVEAI